MSECMWIGLILKACYIKNYDVRFCIHQRTMNWLLNQIGSVHIQERKKLKID